MRGRANQGLAGFGNGRDIEVNHAIGAHNPKVAGSNLASATKKIQGVKPIGLTPFSPVKNNSPHYIPHMLLKNQGKSGRVVRLWLLV